MSSHDLTWTLDSLDMIASGACAAARFCWQHVTTITSALRLATALIMFIVAARSLLQKHKPATTTASQRTPTRRTRRSRRPPGSRRRGARRHPRGRGASARRRRGRS